MAKFQPLPAVLLRLRCTLNRTLDRAYFCCNLDISVISPFLSLGLGQRQTGRVELAPPRQGQLCCTRIGGSNEDKLASIWAC